MLAAIDRLGYAGLVALVALENLFPPVPSEVILPLAGYLASAGRLSLAGVVAAATAGSLLGAIVLYAAGAALGEARLRRLVGRYGRYAAVRAGDLDAAVRWLRRWGHAAVLLCRLIPIARSLISLPAGVVRMPLARFTVLTAAGATVWNASLAGLGYALGASWPRVAEWVRAYQRLVLAAAVALLAAFLWRRLDGRRQRRG